MRERIRPRSAGAAPPHAFDSSAACAALTARSTSSFVALATVASRPPDDGSDTSNVPRSDASARSPSMISCSVMSPSFHPTEEGHRYTRKGRPQMNTEEHRKKNPCISVFIRVYLWRSSFICGVHPWRSICGVHLRLSPDGAQRRAVVRPIDSCLDQRRAVARDCGVDRVIEFALVARGPARHADAAGERDPVHRAERHAGRRQLARLLLDLD